MAIFSNEKNLPIALKNAKVCLIFYQKLIKPLRNNQDFSIKPKWPNFSISGHAAANPPRKKRRLLDWTDASGIVYIESPFETEAMDDTAEDKSQASQLLASAIGHQKKNKRWKRGCQFIVAKRSIDAVKHSFVLCLIMALRL